MNPKTTVNMLQILRAALPEIPEQRRIDLHVSLVSAIGKAEAQHLPVERIIAGVSAWFGVSAWVSEDLLITRMREAIIAATGMRETTLEEDLRHLLRRAEIEGKVVAVRQVPAPPLAMGRFTTHHEIHDATPAHRAFRRTVVR